MNAGTAWVEAAHGAKRSGEEKLVGTKATAELRQTRDFSALALVSECEAAAQTAATKAEALVSGEGSEGLGEQAAEHMRLRAAARRSCQIAEAALGAKGEPDHALSKRVVAAHDRWRRVPR
jgi:hypothetical protein